MYWVFVALKVIFYLGIYNLYVCIKQLISEKTSTGEITWGSPQIYKQLIQLNNEQTTHLAGKQAEDLNRHFSKEDRQIVVGTWQAAQYHLLLEKCKYSGVQHFLKWSEWPSLKSLQIENAGEDVEKRKSSYATGGNVSWYSYCGKQYGGSPHKHAQSLSCAWISVTPWTVAHQVSLPMRFSRQEYWTMSPFPSLGVFPTQSFNLYLLHW